jgi:hypothetical protein
MSEHYSNAKQRKLADKIHEIKKLDVSREQQHTYFKEIKKIIIENNKDAEFVKNANGYLTHFQNFTPNTYIKLEKYINKIEKIHTKQQILEKSLLDSYTDVTSDDNMKRKKEFSKKLRLTNTETHLLNRARYEKELKKNDNDSNNEEYYNTSYNKLTETDLEDSRTDCVEKKNNNTKKLATESNQFDFNSNIFSNLYNSLDEDNNINNTNNTNNIFVKSIKSKKN